MSEKGLRCSLRIELLPAFLGPRVDEEFQPSPDQDQEILRDIRQRLSNLYELLMQPVFNFDDTNCDRVRERVMPEATRGDLYDFEDEDAIAGILKMRRDKPGEHLPGSLSDSSDDERSEEELDYQAWIKRKRDYFSRRGIGLPAHQDRILATILQGLGAWLFEIPGGFTRILMGIVGIYGVMSRTDDANLSLRVDEATGDALVYFSVPLIYISNPRTLEETSLGQVVSCIRIPSSADKAPVLEDAAFECTIEGEVKKNIKKMLTGELKAQLQSSRRGTRTAPKSATHADALEFQQPKTPLKPTRHFGASHWRHRLEDTFSSIKSWVRRNPWLVTGLAVTVVLFCLGVALCASGVASPLGMLLASKSVAMSESIVVPILGADLVITDALLTLATGALFAAVGAISTLITRGVAKVTEFVSQRRQPKPRPPVREILRIAPPCEISRRLSVRVDNLLSNASELSKQLQELNSQDFQIPTPKPGAGLAYGDDLQLSTSI